MVSPFVSQIKRQIATIGSSVQGGVHLWSYFPDPARSTSYGCYVTLGGAYTYLNLLPIQNKVRCRYAYMYFYSATANYHLHIGIYKLGLNPKIDDTSAGVNYRQHTYSWDLVTDLVRATVPQTTPGLVRIKFKDEVVLNPEESVYALGVTNDDGVTIYLGCQLGTPEVLGASPVNSVNFGNQETIAGLTIQTNASLEKSILVSKKTETAPVAYPFIMLASELGDKALPF